MAIVIDIFLLTFMILLLIRDTRKGFLEAAISSSRWFLSFLTAFILTGSVSVLINNLFVYDAVYGSVYQAVSSANINESIASLPFFLKAFAYVSGADLTAAIKDADKSAEAYSAALAKPLAQGVSTVVTFILLIIATYVSIRLLIPPLSRLIKRIPLVGRVNTLGGFFFGILHALLWGWFIAFIGGTALSFLSTASNGAVVSPENTFFMSQLRDFSPIRLFFSLFFR